MRSLSPDHALLGQPPCYICFGRLFHVIWNAVPVELEHCSNLAGTGVRLSCNKARAEKAHYKHLLSGERKIAFGGGRDGVGCGDGLWNEPPR